MNAPSPLRILGYSAEKIHLTAAGVQYIGLWQFPQPFDYWIQLAALVPLFTFVTREVWPIALVSTGRGFVGTGHLLIAAAEIPSMAYKRLSEFRRRIGRGLQRAANYLMSDLD